MKHSQPQPAQRQPQSRLLQRLNEAIAAAPSPAASACLKVQRAILLARHGQLDAARQQLTGLYQFAFQSPHRELSAWLHLAEGLLRFFTDFGSSAEGHVERAAREAQEAGQRELEALAEAWLAHLAYTRHDIEALIRHALAARRLAAADHHAARARAALVLALATHFSGQAEKAGAWYMAARRHGASEGDDATQSAVIYNMAQLRTAQARHRALAQPDAAPAEPVQGADSVAHYDAAVGGSALAELTGLMRAQLLTLKGEFAAARALYEEHLPRTAALGLARVGCSLTADLAWCCVNTGDATLAREHAGEAEHRLAPGDDLDDRALVHSRLAQVRAALGEGALAREQEQLAREAWAAFGRQQQQWAGQLSAAGFDAP